MEAWTRVIVEWINCLEIAQPSVEYVDELKNYVLYHKIVSQLCSSRIGEVTSAVTTVDEREQVSTFLRAEYPEFAINHELPVELTDELYVASLLLVQCSQKATFHRPMCANLKPETQIRVKKFLEMVLPYGKSVNREIVGVAIMETGDSTPITPMTTPVIRPLREFFNSPAARSAQGHRLANDRNRELRRLKAQLETEKFEKLDLIEDARIQDEKIRNLQKKLDDKNREMKKLRNEMTNPATPQSCRKNKRPSDNEDRWRRDCEKLEIANMELRSEIEKLEDEREELDRRLTSKDRLQSATKEKLEQCERSAEALTIQLEMRNNELSSLRMNNEELREHIREIQRSSLGEQSFEMESINRARSPMLMNSSEALSSIVDIQLQEAKEEAAQLKNQLDAASQRLESALSECEDIRRLNETLEKKAAEMDFVSTSLRETEEQLMAITKRAESLQIEKTELIVNLSKLEDALASNKELLATAESRSDALATELEIANSRNNDLEITLEREKSIKAELETTILRGKKECEDLHERLVTTEENLVGVEKVRETVENNLRDKIEKLKLSECDLTNEKSHAAELNAKLSDAEEQLKDLKIVLTTREESLSRSIDEKEKLELIKREMMEQSVQSNILLKNEKDRVTELESTVNRVRDEYEDLKNLFTSNEEKLSRSTDEKNILESNLKTSEKLLKESEERLSNEKIATAKLESIATRTKEELENLKDQLVSKNEEITNVVKTNETLRSNVEECERKLEQSEILLKNEKDSIVELKSTIDHLRKDCHDLQSEKTMIEESLTIEKIKIDNLELAIARGDENAKILLNEIEELKIAMTKEKSTTAELTEILSRTKDNCTELESSLRSKEEFLEENLKLVKSLNDELETRRSTIIDLESSLNLEIQKSVSLVFEISRLNDDRSKLNVELSFAKQILEETEINKNKLQEELMEIDGKMRVTDSNLENLRKQFSQLEEENRKNILANDEMTNNAKNSDEKIIKLEMKIVEYDRSLMTLEETSTMYSRELEILRSVVNDKNSTIDELSLSLEETKNREITLKNNLENVTKKVAELTELGEEVNSQLAQERDELNVIRAERKMLKEELASYVRSEADLKDQIVRITEKLKDSESKLQKQMDSNVVLEKDNSELREARQQLENKLIDEQRQSALNLDEKRDLERELASLVDAAVNTKKHIDQIENELKECTTNLKNQSEANSALTKDKIELTELRMKMENELVQLGDRLTIAQSEKLALQDELASHVRSEADLKDQIARINEKLGNLESKLQEQMDSNVALEKDNSELREARQQLENKLIDEQRQSALNLDEKRDLERELASLVDAAVNTKKHIDQIENELKECTTNLKNQSEANSALTKDKIELTELRMKMENELVQLGDRLTIAQSEKLALQDELASKSDHVQAIKRKLRDLEESQSTLKKQLDDERERMNELLNEKEMMDEELTLYGRSNEDLGKKIIELDRQIEEYKKNLKKQVDENATLKQLELETTNARDKLEKQLNEERERVTIIEMEKKILEEKLFVNEKNIADMNEESMALQTELEASRKENQESREINHKLKKELIDSNEEIKLLLNYKSQSEKLKKNLEVTNEELENSKKRIEQLSENLKFNVEEMKILKCNLDAAKIENVNLSSSSEEKIRRSNDLVETLEQRLSNAEKLCSEARIDEKLKEETIGVLQTKLEQLSKEKIESELRMKEIIVNLQEVRSSQDGVLDAQTKTLKEKIRLLEETENAIVDLRTSLTTMNDRLSMEKSSRLELESQCEKFKEQNVVQTKLIEELKIAMKIEQKKIVEANDRYRSLEKNAQRITKISKKLMIELDDSWKTIEKCCPDVIRPIRTIVEDRGDGEKSEIEDTTRTMEHFVVETETIKRAISSMNRSNEKLTKNMREIFEISKCLKFELDGLWDSVRQACPELARPKREILSNLDDVSKNWEIDDISYAVKSFADDAKKIRKAVSILSEANETLKEHLDDEKSTSNEAEKRQIQLDDRITNLEKEREKIDVHLSTMARVKKNVRESLSKAMIERNDIDVTLEKLKDRWKIVCEKSSGSLSPGSSACDELKNLQNERAKIDELLFVANDRHSRTLKPLSKAICRIFEWSELKLQRIRESTSSTFVDDEITSNDEFSNEKNLVDDEIREIEEIKRSLVGIDEKIGNFEGLVEGYETSVRSGAIKRSTTVEEKLQTQLEKISKERKDMKEKLDAMRLRNARMEKNMDELRSENKRLKTETGKDAGKDTNEIEELKSLTEQLRNEVSRLQRENGEYASKKEGKDRDVETRLKEVHNEYGQKLEKIKQKMKTAYNEQIAKLNQEQEKILKDKMTALRTQMEKQCQKYTEDIAKYKAHISDLSSRYWDVGEKLLAETQEKQAALQRLEQLRGFQEKHEAIVEVDQQSSVAQSRMKTASLDRRDFVADRVTRDGTGRTGYRAVEVIEEETTTYSTRRHSFKSIQAMGNAFNAEDEEGELFDSVYLTDLKEGRCVPAGPDFDRLSELRMRNSMCRPHLKSSYAVETHFQPIALNEDDIKNGVTGDDVFNDSLSQSLLPGQKPKKKDRTQTSYKRPGPPTPSKNGGRLSLQGNELKSPTSRVLRERNVERRTTATPRGLKNLFGTSMSKRQDENTTGTPKGRRLSNIFRKQRTDRN